MNKIYVGNLSYSVTEEDLTNLFAEHGTISSLNLIMDRETGRSKGFAFVEFASKDDFDAALKLDGQDLQGRPLRISEAQAKSKSSSTRGGGDFNRRGNGGKRNFNSRG